MTKRIPEGLSNIATVSLKNPKTWTPERRKQVVYWLRRCAKDISKSGDACRAKYSFLGRN